MTAMSKKAKAEAYDALAEREHYTAAAVDALIDGAVVWSGWIAEDKGDGKYRVGFAGLDRADGGIMLVTFRCRATGQRDTTTVRGAAEGCHYYRTTFATSGCYRPIVYALNDALTRWRATGREAYV